MTAPARTALRPLALVLLVPLALGGRAAVAAVFRADDPIAVDRDDLPIPHPHEVRAIETYELVRNEVLERTQVTPLRALDINTLGEVPDSSWFTNRIGRREMSIEELVGGAGESGPPAPGPWTVVAAKTEGRTLGFRIRDSRGATYLLKFESPGNPETASAADAISSRILHAIGYRVPENHVAWAAREDFVIGRGTRIKAGKERWLDLTDSRLDRMLREVGREPDGRYRVTASRILEGSGIGPFQFLGTRGDDPNDLFPHQHRRVLRGLYVVASWIDHTESGAVNTLDLYLGAEDEGHVIHALVDFDSTLGSAGSSPKRPWQGYEYSLEMGRFLKSLLTLGLWLPHEAGMDTPRLRGIGRAFEARTFSPASFKPSYPNAAFLHLDTEDAFWATRILMRFSDDDLRAIVKTGQLSDAKSEDYLVRTLIARRDAIARHWLKRVSPLDGFRVEGGALRFKSLLQDLGEDEPLVVCLIQRFDNETGARTPLGPRLETTSNRFDLPAQVTGAAAGEHFGLRLDSGGYGVTVFLRRGASGLEVVGIDRDRRSVFADGDGEPGRTR